MGIDLKKMQSKLDNLMNPKKDNAGDGNNFKPQDGDQTIRVLPLEDGDPFKQFYVHYNLRGVKGGVLCPRRNYNEECPICELAFELWSEGKKEKNEDTQKTAKDMFPRERYYSAIIVRGKESDGVKVWSYGKKAYEKMLKLVVNPEYGDVTDFDTGTDLIMSYGKAPGAQFPSTDLNPRRAPSPVAKNDKECKENFGMTKVELLQSIPDLSKQFDRKTPAELMTILETHMNTSEEETKEETKPSNDGGLSSQGNPKLDELLKDDE
jgi:hypothetical protein